MIAVEVILLNLTGSVMAKTQMTLFDLPHQGDVIELDDNLINGENKLKLHYKNNSAKISFNQVLKIGYGAEKPIIYIGLSPNLYAIEFVFERKSKGKYICVHKPSIGECVVLDSINYYVKNIRYMMDKRSFMVSLSDSENVLYVKPLETFDVNIVDSAELFVATKARDSLNVSIKDSTTLDVNIRDRY